MTSPTATPLDLPVRHGVSLAEHTTLTRRVYRGLGHDVSPTEIDDLTAFLRAQLPED